MISGFENLSQEECNIMFRVPALVTVLIAGADNDIDSSEINEAIALTQLKKVTAREILKEYYEKVTENFDKQLFDIVIQFPENSQVRQHFIVEELVKLNTILPKLEFKYAIQFYSSLKDFAKKIAEASGGVFGYIPVGYEESKLVDLPMIKFPEVV